jgi:translation initiation factor 5
MIVINRNTQDPHYRYKMPHLVIKHEGKNTGIKTILSNLEEVSRSLNRSPDHILKFISYELSLQTKLEKQKYIINGKHDQLKIQNIIYDFIDKFVLCYHCENPETFFVLEDTLMMECLACGCKSPCCDHKIKSELSKNKVVSTNIYTEFVKQDGDDVFVYDDISKLEVLIKNKSVKDILSEYEAYIEKNKKFAMIHGFIDKILELGVKKNEVHKFYSRPQSGKKRSVEFKKEISKYFNQ